MIRALVIAMVLVASFSAAEVRADDVLPRAAFEIVTTLDGPSTREREQALEPLRHRARWFRGLALSTAAVALVGYAALPFDPEYPVFETFAGLAGAGTVLSAVFLGAWVASRFELGSAERALDGGLQTERASRRRRRHRLLGFGGLFLFVGAALVVAAIVPGARGETAALARGVTLGSIGGALSATGLATLVRGATLRERPSVSLSVGLGSIGFAGSF